MKIGNGPIVIPWDFTEVAANALEYTVSLSGQFNNKHIALIHIVKSSKDISSKLTELEQIAKDNSKKYHLDIQPYVKAGKLTSAIGDFAEEMEAELVIMGTHGIREVQKLKGSRALKIVIHSQVPFIILRKPIDKKGIKKVVFPVQYKTETKEKLNLVSFLYKLFQPSFHIYKPNYQDEGFQKKARTNLTFCKLFLEERGINYELEICHGKDGFVNELLNYSEKVKADLILLIASKNFSFLDYWTGTYEQHIMANEAGIPVMIQNPNRELMKYQTFH